MKTRILIIEDDTEIRELLQEALTLEGYSILAAANGKEGLHCLATEQDIQLILLDMMMPGMNGWQFLEERARLTAPRIPVLVLSAVGEDFMDAPAVDGFVPKPLDIASLLQTIREHLASSQDPESPSP